MKGRRVMSSFQTQSQWENDSGSISTDNKNCSPSTKGIKISRRIIVVICLLFAAILIAGAVYFGTARSIEGLWVRQMDDYNEVAGMVVEVKDGKGTIVALPETADAFFIGQTKWLGIKKIGFGQYECYMLCHKEADDTYGYDDGFAKVTVSSDGSSLSSICTDNSSKGQYQLWKRIKEIP